MKRNNFFSRNYHQLTTRYNVYFNGNQALKTGLKNMEIRHKEDYTNLLPVFVSNNDQTRAMCSSDMDYAVEKAAKAIDKHSITAKPRRRKNKDSKSYETFRKKKEFNNQMDKCYLLLGKAYFYKKKYAMANNTFRFIQRQYAEDEEIMTETAIWLFRSLTEMGRYDEAAKSMAQVEGAKLKRQQAEMYEAARTDFYVRQGLYAQAIPVAEKLVGLCKNMKRKPRYNFMLSQLYLKENRDANAMLALKKSVRFNFNYEMVFNARINMALAYRNGEATVERQLKKMLRDPKNTDFQDRIYYALANIEEKRGNEGGAVDLYWKSVRSSVDNENQQALSFCKLGDYYFKERNYPQAQTCYDSCLYVMDSRYEDYDKLKVLLTDLTDLVSNLQIIQMQDSLLTIAALSESERNNLIDGKIQDIQDQEAAAKEQERKEQAERSFFDRNNMLSRGDAFSQNTTDGGDWYFYNPVTISLGKNDFKRKWGRRKLEDNWRRQNKAMVEFSDVQELAEEKAAEGEVKDVKSREYYLKDVPLTEEAQKVSEKKIEEAYYRAGELYMYKFDDPVKAQECFDSYIKRFATGNNLPIIYYLAYKAADKAGNPADAARYKKDLISRFPESDFALGLQDPNYFRKVEDVLRVVEKKYEEAYELYRQVYYEEAGRICDEILSNYPDNKLKTNVLFLKAMCIVNTRSPQEGREALERVVAAFPAPEMMNVTNGILASLSVGDKPAVYTAVDMDQARTLQANRNWAFDEEVVSGKSRKEESAYLADKEKVHAVYIVLPEDFNLAQETRFKARLTFINASEAVEGKKYESEKEALWYQQQALVIRKFDNAPEALEYLNRVGTDKHLLKIIGDHDFRMFAISEANQAILKRMKNVGNYVDFFAENYFADRRQGEIIAGKWGAAAHIFTHVEDENCDFVLAVPFRDVNTKRIAEALHLVDPAFTITKEDYDNHLELIVVKNVGAKVQALDYMNAVMKNKDVFDRLAGIDYDAFIITEHNLSAMLENQYLEEYVKFFTDNYLKAAGAVGVEDGDYVYNKSVPHKFVLFYPNTIDPFKLKSVFEEFNFAGLSMSNQKFDDEHDCMLVTGLEDKEKGMRYFNTVVNDRKLFKPLKNTDYTNFIITEVNLQTLMEKKNLNAYLEFFRKYYLD